MEPTQAQAEPTPATAAPTSEAGNQPQPTLENASLEDLDAVQREGAKVVLQQAASVEAEQEAATTETPPETPPAEVPPETPPAEAPPETPTETPPAEPTPPAATEPPEPPAGEIPERFRFKNPTDRAIAAVKKAADVNGTPITWAEAERRVSGETTAPTEVPPDPVAVASTSIETLRGEITDLEGQINPEDEGDVLSSKAMREATVKLAEKRAELVKAELQLDRAQSAAEAERQNALATQREAREESRNRAIELYPDAADANTQLGAAIAARFEEMKDPDHPDHPLLYADTAPERIAKDVAAELGIAPKAKTASPPPPPATPPAPTPKKATPVSGRATSVPVTPAEGKTVKSFEELRDKSSLEELDAFSGANTGVAAAIR